MLARMMAAAAALALGLAAAPPVAAQGAPAMLTARQPAGIVIALINAGYEAELTADQTGDPMIIVEGDGYKVVMLFYGCNEERHDECDSVQLRTAFDRAEPWTAADALEVSRRYRYAAVALDDEGDPYLTWDIVTGAGISSQVFLDSLKRFENTADLAAELVFAAEIAAEEAAAAAAPVPPTTAQP